MKADWILPDEKKLEVKLKILRDVECIQNVMRLTEKWSSLSSPELIKIFGFTLTKPHTLVVEYTHGPLDQLMRRFARPFGVIQLIDAAYSLARALQYLQENKIIHGRIRCNTLQVVHYSHPEELKIRLGDPGLVPQYTDEE